MKTLLLLALAISLASCGEDEFGFRENPMAVAASAARGISAGNLNQLNQALGRAALCQWGTQRGLELLRRHVPSNILDLDLEIAPVSAKHLPRPVYLGYWAYYRERYALKILNKQNGELIADATADCHFGGGQIRNMDLLEVPEHRYSTRRCRITNLEPRTFEAPAMHPRCRIFLEE